MKSLSLAMEKNKKHTAGKDEDRGGGLTLAQMYKKKLEKDRLAYEDARKIFDQYGNEISMVDKFLYNEFKLVDLIKLKLDFLALIYLKKDMLQHNFDIKTNIELNRFE
jgi:hypothetical protein